MTYQREPMEIQGTCIQMLRGGRGEPLLFLHGASGGGKWLPFFDKLADAFSVYAPEHPGFGLSDDPEWLEETTDLVLFYKDLLDRLGFERVHLVGHALGGWLAAEFATLFAERLYSLTLMDAAGIHVEGAEPADNFTWHPDERARNLYYNNSFVEEKVKQTLSDEEIAIEVKNQTTTAKLVWTPRWYSLSLGKRLGRIASPTLILWGKEDRFFPLAMGESFHQRIAGSQMNLIPLAGHNPHVEQAEQTAQAIIRFTANLPAAKA